MMLPTCSNRNQLPIGSARLTQASWFTVISGAFYFGATASVSAVPDRIGEHPKTFILDFADVPIVDSTAARTLEGFAHKLDRAGTKLYFTSANTSVRRTLLAAGLRTPLVHYAPEIKDAVALSRGEKPVRRNGGA